MTLSKSSETPRQAIPLTTGGRPPDGLRPLAPGTLLLDRYVITTLLASDEKANVYRVAAMQRCAVCNVENDGTAEVCGFCGSPLPPPTTRRVVEQRAPDSGTPIPSTSYLLDGKLYTFVRDTDEDNEPATRALRLNFGYRTDPGIQRGATGEPNQDALGILQLAAQSADGAPSIGLAIVADGIGGAQAGQEASRLAIQAILQELNTELLMPFWNRADLTDEQVRAALTHAITNANSALIDWADKNTMQSGTTLTLALFIDRHVIIANLGDSRTYLVRNGELRQITQDHSYIAHLVANGTVTAEDAYNHPQRNLILKSLGDPTGYDIDLFPAEGGAYELLPGDQWLLCSDGLWEMVREPEILQVLMVEKDPQAACAQLVNLANRAGGMDNITVVVGRLDSF